MSSAVATPVQSYPLTDITLRLLKNFATINPQVVLKEGTAQRTAHPQKSVLALADFETDWPQTTAIYQLPELLSNISAYDKPVLTLEEKQFRISGANSPSHVEYPYSDPSVVTEPPDKTFSIKDPYAEFVLPERAIAEIKKLSAINNLPTIAIEVNGEEQTIVIKPHDEKNPATRVYAYPVHSNAANIKKLADETFTFFTRREYFDLIMDGEYTVSLRNWKYVHLKHNSEPIAYYIVAKTT